MIDEKKLIEELEQEWEKESFRGERANLSQLNEQAMQYIRGAYCFASAIHLVKTQPKVDEWIPCVLGVMPPEKDSIFKKFKGTDKWKEAMFEKTSPQVQVTIEFEDGKRMTSVSHTIDGKWRHDLEPYNSSKVVAWKPLSDPYQEEVTE